MLGGVAGVCTLAGIAILIYRRRTTGPVFMATTRNDKVMYVVLVSAICSAWPTTLVPASRSDARLPGVRVAVVPVAVRVPAGRVADGRRAGIGSTCTC